MPCRFADLSVTACRADPLGRCYPKRAFVYRGRFIRSLTNSHRFTESQVIAVRRRRSGRRCRAGQVCVPVREGAVSLLFMQVRLPFSASWPRCRSRVLSSSSVGSIRLRRSRCLVWTAPLADRFPSCRQRFVVVATLTISDDRRAEVVLDHPHHLSRVRTHISRGSAGRKPHIGAAVGRSALYVSRTA